MAWLGQELLEKEQDARTPFAPRCLKDVVEERLFAHRRDLRTELDLVFMDTTSLYFEGAGGQILGRHGYSKDHRPDLRQMILAVLIDGDGRPVCSEMWPGDTADVTTLIPVIDRLRARFAIARVCVVADRGMISAEAIAELETRGFFYILGVRERTDKLVRELVLDDPAPFVPLALTKRGKEIDYEAKTVTLAGAVTSSAATSRRRRRTPPIALRSWRRFSGSSPRATRRSSAMPAFAATSRRSARSTLRSITTRSRRRRSSTDLRAAHQCRSQPARGHALLQAVVDGGYRPVMPTLRYLRMEGRGWERGGGRRRQGSGVARAALRLATVAASAVTSFASTPPTLIERLLSRSFLLSQSATH